MGEKENSGIRIKALLNELDRQQSEVRKKKKLIRIIVSSIAFVTLVTIGFLFHINDNFANETIHVVRGSDMLVKDMPKVQTKINSYQVVFENFAHYPLARFFSEKEAKGFQKEIKKLHLPTTLIHVDSLSGKEKVLAISSNYRYYIQFGIFRNKLISISPENMVYLHQIKDKELYKYRLGPFTRGAQAKHLVKDLSLKDYLIVEVSN